MLRFPQFGLLRRVLLGLAYIPLFLLFPARATAQAVWGKAGTSTLMQASGFEINYKWMPVQGWIGMGVSDSFNIGGYLQTRALGTDIGLGDRYLPFVLSTDVFEQSRFFSARGVFIHRDQEYGSWTAFGGATSAEVSYSFYRSFVAEDATAGFIFDRKLSDRISFRSFNFAQSKFTSIQSLGYQVNDQLNLSVAAGTGNSQYYFSTAGEYSRKRLQILGSYTASGDSFVRIGGVSSIAPERVGANLRVRYQPWKCVQLTGGHENMMSPVLQDGELPARVSLDSIAGSTQLMQFRMGGSVSKSGSGLLHTTTESYSISRNLTQRIGFSASTLRFHSATGLETTLLGSINEKISPRLNVYEGVTRANGAENMIWGARLLTNRFTYGIEHTLIYSPLAGGFSGKQYMQAWSMNISLPLAHGVRLHGDAFVDVTGKMRYTAWGDGIGFARGGESIPNAAPSGSPSIGSFIVKGRVVDTNGKPVWGIAIQVDGQQTYSDSSGQFYLRFRKGETYPVAVLTDRSINRTEYSVVQAPITATSEDESAASDIVIILRPATPSPK